MKHLILGAALLALTTPAIAQDNDDSEEWFASRSVLTQQTGEGIYNAVCAGCHMPEGEGAEGAGMYPALAENEMLEFPDYAINLIVHGQKAMPPLGGVLDDAQVAAVVEYIRTSFGNDYDSPVAAEDVANYR